MSRNIKILLLVSVLIGASMGIYELVLPFYLKEQGISFAKMGYIFSISTLAMFALRIVSGSLADSWGRKKLYMVGILASALATSLTPLTASILLLILLKTFRDVGMLMRDTVHPILLYEEDRGGFMNFLGKTRGMEFIFQAAGTTIAGLSYAVLGSRKNLWLAGILIGLALVSLAIGFRENISGKKIVARQAMLKWDLPRNLKIIMVSNFIFSIGLGVGHSFIVPLFFSEKFHVSAGSVSVIMIIHRLTFAIPLLLIGNLKIQNLKAFYIGALILQGIVMSASALIPNFVLAAVIWLLHDLVGAGIWQPIQSTIIQRSCREDSRGSDMSKTIAFSALGGALGPTLAGYLSSISISLPFFVGGLLILVSGFPLIRLSVESQTDKPPISS